MDAFASAQRAEQDQNYIPPADRQLAVRPRPRLRLRRTARFDDLD